MSEAATPWVDAAPFRAHLRHVMAVGDMGVDVVAALTGIPTRAARHLLNGRGGRPVRRISPDTARRLLRVTSADARWAGQRLVPAPATAARLNDLLAAGHSLDELAVEVHIAAAELLALAEGRRDACTPLVEARLAALHRGDGRTVRPHLLPGFVGSS